MSSSSMMYSIVITTGPVRALDGDGRGRCVPRCRSGSRLSSPDCDSGTQRPSSAQASMTTAAISSAALTPSSAATSPHSQLPAAMPPNAAI